MAWAAGPAAPDQADQVLVAAALEGPVRVEARRLSAAGACERAAADEAGPTPISFERRRTD